MSDTLDLINTLTETTDSLSQDEMLEADIEQSAIEEIEAMQAKLTELRRNRDIAREKKVTAARKKKEVESKLNLLQAEYEEEKAQAQREFDATDIYDRMIEHAKSKNFKWLDAAKPHQWNGALTLANWGSALLADEPGLGKSLTAIMYADMLPAYESYGAKKILVVVPNDLVSEFTREFQTWAPHRQVLPVQGANETHRNFVRNMTQELEEFVIITNYESLWQDFTWISQIEYDTVMIDEFHNAKNAKGLTFGAVQQLKTRNFLPITATFILNEPGDIFPALSLVAPKSFPDKRSFLTMFCQQNFQNKWTFQEGGEKALMDRLGSRIVKRNLADAEIELPTQHHREIDIDFETISQGQKDIIEEIANKGMITSGDDSQPINAIIAAITRERQASCYPNGIKIYQTEQEFERLLAIGRPFETIIPVGNIVLEVKDVESAKVDFLFKRLETMQEKGKRSVVFSMFTGPLKDLEVKLNEMGIRAVLFIGDTPKEERNRIKKDFRRNPDGSQPKNYKYDVVLCNYKTGGVGLTLTGATYMCKLDEEWSPGKNEQAHRRIYRIGQTEETLVETVRIVRKPIEGVEDERQVKSIDQWMKSVNDIKQNTVDGFESEVNLAEMYKAFKGLQPKPKVKKTLADMLLEEDDLFA